MNPFRVRLGPMDSAARWNSRPMPQPSADHWWRKRPGWYLLKSSRNLPTTGLPLSLYGAVRPVAYTELRHGALKSDPTFWLQASMVETLAVTVKLPRSIALHSFWLDPTCIASQMPCTPFCFMLTTSVSKLGAAKFSPLEEPPPSYTVWTPSEPRSASKALPCWAETAMVKKNTAALVMPFFSLNQRYWPDSCQRFPL